MAIGDLLWACPECGAVGAIVPDESGSDAPRCRSCGTGYRRGRGAAIIASPPNRPAISRPAHEWVDRLPPLDPVPTDADGACRRERVEARFAEGDRTVRARRRYLNRIERLGERRGGTLTLTEDHLSFESGDEIRHWPLDEMTAIQASSSTLQIKARSRPVVSFRFPEGSLRLWEELITTTLRRRYRETGRGEIIEFQPRIATR